MKANGSGVLKKIITKIYDLKLNSIFITQMNNEFIVKRNLDKVGENVGPVVELNNGHTDGHIGFVSIKVASSSASAVVLLSLFGFRCGGNYLL
jgi:hypothetical protein